MISQTHYNYPLAHDVQFGYPYNSYSQPSGSMPEQCNGTDSDPESWMSKPPTPVEKVASAQFLIAAVANPQLERPAAKRWDSLPTPHHERATSSRHNPEDCSDSSDRSTRDASSSSPKPPSSSEHAWAQRSQITTSKALNHLVMEFSTHGVKSFFCGWPGCKHPVGFAQKPQLITHIRSAHLQEKPFVCTTCNTQFSRKQEASRHVLSMNSGRKYKCSGCHQAFSRKNYRDAHEETCMYEEPRTLSLPESRCQPDYGNHPSLYLSPV